MSWNVLHVGDLTTEVQQAARTTPPRWKTNMALTPSLIERMTTNSRYGAACYFKVWTSHSYLDVLLVDMRIFSASSEVYKTRPDLFRALNNGERVQVGGLTFTIEWVPQPVLFTEN